ncbi:MAG TPA: DsrH/TusB family sulfur metabolism protein [Thermoplasmata archaeon]|nr:DsrH/TusB family sulfur metabolism protein [Thermoplasmata archaeon]
MANSILVLITRAPYGLEEAFAGLRLALAMGVNGMKTSVLMMEDGIYNAVGTQKPEAVRMPSNIEATKELYDFDVPVYVVKEDLDARGIPESNLFEGLKAISVADVKTLLTEHDVVTTF